MESLETELSKGSRIDPILVLAVFLCCVFGFAFLYKTAFWAENQYSWKPMVMVGASLFAVYVYRRLFCGKLRFTLVKDEGSHLTFQKTEHIATSGWILRGCERVKKSDVKSVKIENFSNVATNTGMYWVCFTMQDRSVIEYRVNDYSIVERVKAFASTSLPGVELAVGERA